MGSKWFRVAAGFDGFIDLLVRPVKQICAGGPEYFTTIAQFGNYLSGKANLSCSLALSRITERAGGNAPLLAAALSALGVKCDCIGALGWPEPDKRFFGLGEYVQLTGVTMPGQCTALEFDDGKVMLACNDTVDELDYDLLKGRVGTGRLTEWLDQADAAAFCNWSEMKHSASIWKGLLDEILPQTASDKTKPLLVDISDCSRRSDGDIREMLELMKAFTAHFKVVFSLNYNEAQVICKALGLPARSIAEAAENVYALAGVDLVALHLPDGAYAVDRQGGCFLPGRHIEQPVLSTGGGDHFNAGLLWGLLWGLSNVDAVHTANTIGSMYVAGGKSPSADEVYQNRPFKGDTILVSGRMQ
jgi:sugar/nucleoside kinase (ribokinase family)